MDPSLGGQMFTTPSLAPGSTFALACKNTPDGFKGYWIIPWDHRNSDFVYAAVDDTVYRGHMTAYDLKMVSRTLLFLIPRLSTCI